MAVLVGGVGYSNLRDLSFGRVLQEKLESQQWPEHVHVVDLSFGAIMIYQALAGSSDRFDKAVIATAAKRGREPGTLHVYEWNVPLPDAEEIQARVAEAVTGVIHVDHLLIICKHFGVLPEKVVLVEVEPKDERWGMELSPEIAAKADEALAIISREVERSASPGAAGHAENP